MNKKLFGIGAVALLVCAVAFAQNTLVYLEQGGAKQVILSGGEVEIRSGGVLDVQSGGTVVLAGATLSATELGFVDGVTAGTATASKAVVLGASKEIATITSATITTLTTSGITGTGVLARSGMTEDSLAAYGQDLYSCFNTLTYIPLSAVDVNDTYHVGTVGTGAVGLISEVADNETETNYFATCSDLPVEYVAGEAVSVVILSKITNTVTTATVDVAFYEVSATGTLSADLSTTTPAQTITTSFVAHTFVITPTGLAAGDNLLIAVTTAVADPAAGTTAEVQVLKFNLLLDVKG